MPAPATAIFVRMRSFGECARSLSRFSGSRTRTVTSGMAADHFSMRRILDGSLDDRHEHPFANAVIHIAPANAVASEGQQPDHEGGCVPQNDERHLFPESALCNPQTPTNHVIATP